MKHKTLHNLYFSGLKQEKVIVSKLSSELKSLDKLTKGQDISSIPSRYIALKTLSMILRLVNSQFT